MLLLISVVFFKEHKKKHAKTCPVETFEHVSEITELM